MDMELYPLKVASLCNLNYDLEKRYGSESGLNPEELIGAAISVDFSMSLARELESKGIISELIAVETFVDLKNISLKWSITDVELKITVTALQSSIEEVRQSAHNARMDCPILKILNTTVYIEIKYLSAQEGMLTPS